MSKIFLQDTTVNSNTNNDSIKAVNDLKKFNTNPNQRNSNKNLLQKDEKKNPIEFNFSLGLGFRKEKLDKNYWNKEPRRRKARQKTVLMRGMKFIDNKLNIIVILKILLLISLLPYPISSNISPTIVYAPVVASVCGIYFTQ